MRQVSESTAMSACALGGLFGATVVHMWPWLAGYVIGCLAFAFAASLLRGVVEHDKHARRQRSCSVWCPNCRRLLNGDNIAFVSDDEQGVRYRCPCGAGSLWDFDAPVPLLRSWDVSGEA